MRAMVLARFGGPNAFDLRDLPVPPPGPRQVRVAVRATSINPLDIQIRRGDYKDLVDPPAVIGHDVSGVVEAVGDGVAEFAPGDEVYYTPRIFGGPGSYAERHVADADLLARKPRNLTHAEAASLTLAGGTVWEALVTRARVEIGETVLVHGGAGGVGAIAVQLAHACGARVLTTCRAADADFVRGLGADAAIDFEAEDHLDAVLRLTDGRGADVMLDTRGGDTLARAPRALAPLGRVVTLVDLATPQNLIEAWGKNATYHFVFTRQNRGKLDALTALVERGLVLPLKEVSAVGWIRRLNRPWSPSSRLFRCLACRCSRSGGIAPSFFSSAIASPSAAFLSVLISAGSSPACVSRRRRGSAWRPSYGRCSPSTSGAGSTVCSI